MTSKPRLRTCVEAWPEAETMGYDPRCCRFPKSCSADLYDEQHVKPGDLEDVDDVTSAAPEPTDEQLDLAQSLIEEQHSGWCSYVNNATYACSCRMKGVADAIARALAAAVAAEREKYQRVADEMAQLADNARGLSHDFPFEHGIVITAESAARRIREVAG